MVKVGEGVGLLTYVAKDEPGLRYVELDWEA